MTDDNDSGNTFSRRKILGGIATLGAAGAVAGSGTMAIFNDTEDATADVAAGTLDLKVDGEDETAEVINVTDIAPGDSDSTTFNLANAGSLDGVLLTEVESYTNTEGSPSEFNDGGDGELADNLKLDVNLGNSNVFSGTLAEFVAAPPQPSDLDAGWAPEFDVSWELPFSAGNEVQGDSISLTLLFTLVQKRNTVLPSDTGTYFPPMDVDKTFKWQARAKYANNSAQGASNGQAELTINGEESLGNTVWQEGVGKDFELSYDGTTATLTVDGTTITNDVGSAAGNVALIAKGTDGTTDVSDLVLNGDAVVPGSLSVSSGRQWLVFDGALDQNGEFALSGTVALSDFASAAGESPGIQFSVE